MAEDLKVREARQPGLERLCFVLAQEVHERLEIVALPGVQVVAADETIEMARGRIMGRMCLKQPA